MTNLRYHVAEVGKCRENAVVHEVRSHSIHILDKQGRLFICCRGEWVLIIVEWYCWWDMLLRLRVFFMALMATFYEWSGILPGLVFS